MLTDFFRLEATTDRASVRANTDLLTQIIARTTMIVALLAAVLLIFVLLAASSADELAMVRQQRLIATVIGQNYRMVAHEQESATVWDESVRRVRAKPLDLRWMDENLGIWFYTYHLHDETFVIDSDNRPIYAMQSGRRSPLSSYDESLAKTVAPLIANLRASLYKNIPVTRYGQNLSPGRIDLGIVHGHPAIISIKPIVSDTDRLTQTPGRQFLHISVRYLDGRFVRDLAQRYQLDHAAFSFTAPRKMAARSVPIVTRSGHLLGYLIWSPFKPGSIMFTHLLPVLAGALVLVFAFVMILLMRISRSALQLTNAKERAQHLAHHDPLTGLANRALFELRLNSAVANLAPYRSVALLYIDLDHFKDVNDRLGHPTGDALIQSVGAMLHMCAGPQDTVARLGGDEFAIIHMCRQGSSSAADLCQHIAAALGKPIDLADGEVVVAASIGIAMAPGDATNSVELVRKADIALYDAKSAGRRRHSFFCEEMSERIRYRHEISRDLRAAIHADDLRICYQPYIDTRTRGVCGFEALVRWTHPKYGEMAPEDFIPIAEESGLIETLGEWVLEEACLAASRWSIDVSVNISAVQLRNPGLVERIFFTLRRTRLAPSRLELEITETSFLECSEACRENLGHLRDIGVRIALDDFGTGYSSFKHLQSFEVDRLKIDQSFIAKLNLSTGGSPVVQAIVDLARTAGIQTTAEGVETEAQLRYLTSIGCNSIQGYLLSKPLAVDEMPAFLTVTSVSPSGLSDGEEENAVNPSTGFTQAQDENASHPPPSAL